MRPRVYIAGPLTNGGLENNIRSACEVGVRLLKAGFAPYVPHLSCYADGPEPSVEPSGTTYEEWMEHSLEWVKASDALLRLPGHSPGAEREVAAALLRGIPVFHCEADLLAWAKQG